MDGFAGKLHELLRRGVYETLKIGEGVTDMKHVDFFARRIVSVIALAMLVSGGWSQVIYAQPAGIDPQADKLLRRMGE